MLKLFEYNAKNFNSGQTAFLENAADVKVTREINGNNTLSFNYPLTDRKADMIQPNKIVLCMGQAYRIMKIWREFDGRSILSADCEHVYNADASMTHLQNMPDMIGALPSEVIRKAFSGTDFTLFTDSELNALGMRRVDYDGFKIDFFSEDKTNPYDIMQSVIANCGKGEIYIDNYKIALVERIGKNNGVRLNLGKNLENLTIERDMSNLITRLYPYGESDMHIGSVNNQKQYIDSENISLYGLREGFTDLSDCRSPEKLKNRALWEFDPMNSDRIDVPDINISGDVIDLSKLAQYGDFEKIEIGDTVAVKDGSAVLLERVIKIEYYPYEVNKMSVSIGRVKKDLFFYLDQIGTLTKRYKKISTGSGKIKALSIDGNVSVDGISVNGNGEREFSGVVNAPRITLSGVEITEKDGEIYINGKKILYEEGEETA